MARVQFNAHHQLWCNLVKLRIMQYKILTDSSASGLNIKVQDMIEIGWKPKGGHKVVEKHHQPKFSGIINTQTIIRSEYSQTLIKE